MDRWVQNQENGRRKTECAGNGSRKRERDSREKLEEESVTYR